MMNATLSLQLESIIYLLSGYERKNTIFLIWNNDI